jgi:predicted DNA binding CopG/RHH family protein
MPELAGFDWDEGNLAKCCKHGVSVEEIEFVLSNDPIVSPDVMHSLDEQRTIAVGLSVMSRKLVEKVPVLTTDEEAEAFLDQDLSGLDFSAFKPVRFEFQPKDERVNMRLPKPLLEAVKARAAKSGVPYQRFIRQTLEAAVAERPRKSGKKLGTG